MCVHIYIYKNKGSDLGPLANIAISPLNYFPLLYNSSHTILCVFKAKNREKSIEVFISSAIEYHYEYT